MRPFYDLRGNPLTPGRCLGRGGEGAVYAVAEHPRRVAKIYARRPLEETVHKLAAMIALGSPELRKVVAWPEGLLLESRGGPVAGFVMPRVQGHREVHCLYGPKSRKEHFPRASWAFLVRAARNLAAAFDSVHDHGLVVGDVNPGNAVVSAKALVRLIDSDSFQVSRNGTTWPCPVGVPEFTPPELQGERFDSVVRTPEHDAFGLAVLIFHLLFMGRHPFAGRHPGPGEVPIEEAIREGLFAFGWDAAARGSGPPPRSLRLADVPRDLGRLFERALERRQRPARPLAGEWVQALEALEDRLVVCESDENHVHAGVNGRCPWCRLEGQGGPFFFPLSLGLKPGPGFDVEAAWDAIEKVPPPGEAPPLPRPPRRSGLRGRLLPTGMIYRTSRILLLLLTVGAIVALVVGTGGKAMPVAALLLWVIGPHLSRGGPEQAQYALRERGFIGRRQNLRLLERRWVRECGREIFEETKETLRRRQAEYKGLEAAQTRELELRARQLEVRQLEAYLDRHPVETAAVEGLLPLMRSALSREGVATAADVTPQRLDDVWELSPEVKLDLLVWRRRLQDAYVPAREVFIPEADLRAVQERFRRRREELEAELLRGPVELRRAKAEAVAARDELAEELLEAQRQVTQARADLRMV